MAPQNLNECLLARAHKKNTNSFRQGLTFVTASFMAYLIAKKRKCNEFRTPWLALSTKLQNSVIFLYYCLYFTGHQLNSGSCILLFTYKIILDWTHLTTFAVTAMEISYAFPVFC